ncbi:hypothetical protein LRS06_08855 [Hymenobacter sp. J193]|uniref:hypothetical protein n=1 Tax=Hymenobacter sp. J193 TaxID=2898429 RepID=UPI0021513258|nr:hypothetical protein [Hymenobacter sp. J193]MCR5887886.1 hypothetical protein [Hymenobacter sp. J193]
MSSLYPQRSSAHVAAAYLSAIDLDTVDALQVARTLRKNPSVVQPQLVVDCGALQCLRTLGVSHVVSQLLVLRQAGASIWLCNADSTLRRCLDVLKLQSVFLTIDE